MPGTISLNATLNANKWFGISLNQAGGGSAYWFRLDKADGFVAGIDIFEKYVFRQQTVSGVPTSPKSLNSGSLDGIGSGPSGGGQQESLNFFEYKVKNEAAGEDVWQALVDDPNINTDDGGGLYLIGQVKLTAYKDAWNSEFSDAEMQQIFGEPAPNPSYANILFQVKSGNEKKFNFILENCLKNSNLLCNDSSSASALCSTLILNSVDVSDLAVDQSNWPSDSGKTLAWAKGEFENKLGIQYKTCNKVTDGAPQAAASAESSGNSNEIPNFHSCFKVTSVEDEGTPLSCSDPKTCKNELWARSKMLKCSLPAGDPCDDEMNCSGKGRALFNAKAVNLSMAIGMDPTTVRQIGCAVDTTTTNGDSAIGFYKWISYSTSGIRKAQSFNGVASVVAHEVTNDTLLCLNTDYRHSTLEVTSYMKEVRNTIFTAAEEWRQCFTIMRSDPELHKAMSDEMAHKDHIVQFDSLELAKMTLKRVMTHSKSRGMGIKGDNFVVELSQNMMSEEGEDSVSTTATYNAKIRYEDFLKFVTGEVQGTGEVTNETIMRDTIEVSCTMTNGSSTSRWTDPDAADGGVESGSGLDNPNDWIPNNSMFTMVNVGIRHSIYFINGWEVDYQASFSGNETTNIDGTTETFSRYAGFGIRKSLWKDHFLFSGSFNSKGGHSLGIYNSPGKFTKTIGPAKLGMTTGATFDATGFSPTLGFNISFFESLDLSYNALTGSSKAMFQKGVDYTSGNLETSGYSFSMNLHGTADLLQGNGQIAIDVTFEAALFDCKKLHSKVYFKANMNGRFGYNMPGSGLIANEGISFKAGISASLIYQADWLKFLGIPLRIGFGPSLGAALNIYTGASGIGGNTGGSGSAFAMTMGIWHFSYEILDTLDLELQVQHQSVLGKVPFIGFLLKYIPLIGNLGPKESSPDYIKRVVPVRTANLMIGCRKEYELWIQQQFTQIEKDETRRVINNNLCMYNDTTDKCHQARVIANFIYVKKKETLENNPFCAYIRSCFSTAKLNKLTQVYRNVPTGNWENENDDSEGGEGSWDKTKCTSEMHMLEDEQFELFIDANSKKDLKEAAKERTGLIMQIFAMTEGSGKANIIMGLFGTFQSLFGAVANIVTFGTFASKKDCKNPDGDLYCPEFGTININHKDNSKTLENLYDLKKCDAVQSLGECEKFYKAFLKVWEAYLSTREIHEDLAVLEPQLVGCPLPDSIVQQFLDRHVAINTLSKLKINNLTMGQSLLRTLCPADDDLTKIEGYSDFYGFSDGDGTGSDCAGANPNTPCGCGEAILQRLGIQGVPTTILYEGSNVSIIHSADGTFNPCKLMDEIAPIVAESMVHGRELHGKCVQAITNPLCTELWDCDVKNYGAGSFTSLCEIQRLFKSCKILYCDTWEYGAAYDVAAEIEAKVKNFNIKSADAKEDIKDPLKKAILQQLGWFLSCLTRGFRYTVVAGNKTTAATAKKVEDDFWDTDSFFGTTVAGHAINLDIRCKAEFGETTVLKGGSFPFVGFIYGGEFPSYQKEGNLRLKYVDEDGFGGIKKIADFTDSLRPSVVETDSGFFC